MDNIKNTFDFEPSKKNSLMLPAYKSKKDTTDFFNDADKAQYWKYIGEIQWAIALGQVDIVYDTAFYSLIHYQMRTKLSQ